MDAEYTGGDAASGVPSHQNGSQDIVNVDESSVVGAAANVPIPDPGFSCSYCGQSFTTKTGLGVHKKRAHPAQYEREINVDRKKARWSEEENRLLARKEADLKSQGCKRINEALHVAFPHRSQDAIRAHRRDAGYKQLVLRYMESQSDLADQLVCSGVNIPTAIQVQVHLSRELLAPFEEVFYTIRSASSIKYKEHILNNIWRQIAHSLPQYTYDSLTLYIKEVFPLGSKMKSSINKQTKDTQMLSRRQKRHLQYKETQYIYKKNRSRCIKQVLDPCSAADGIDTNTFFQFWRTVLSNRAGVDTIEDGGGDVLFSELWSPITVNELSEVDLPLRSAPGPDGVTVRDMREIPRSVLVKIYNLLLVLSDIPEELIRARTTFIPKQSDSMLPEQFRPITITSCLLRLFHKVLARRLRRVIKFDERQTGFLEGDGVAQHTLLLDLLIRRQRSKLKPLFMASIDIHKAFDRVSHSSLLVAARAHGLPPQFLTYLEKYYMKASTVLTFGNEVSEAVNPSCGVRQGDPLSPFLFNMIIDQFLKLVPDDIGIDVGDRRYAVMAYADDLVLTASTEQGLQQLIDIASSFFEKCGLQINTLKSFSLSLVPSGKEKKIKVDKLRTFSIQGRSMAAMGIQDCFKYLGVSFDAFGRKKVVKVDLFNYLMRLRKAPLKPQQRLFALRHYLLPRFYHSLVLGQVYIGTLRQFDRVVRAEVRRWLSLPNDTPNAYFHAAVCDGGLGIPSLRWMVPFWKKARLSKLLDNLATDCDVYVQRELAYCNKFLWENGTSCKSRGDIADFWKRTLYKAVDGGALIASGKVKDQHSWVSDGSNFLGARDFVSAIKLRINALPVRARTTRGRPQDRACRAGCSAPETLHHVLQQCPRTHNMRIKRHDALVQYIYNKHKNESKVVMEPVFKTLMGRRNPDLLVIREGKAAVLDAQVVHENFLVSGHHNKINYYRNNADLVYKIKETYRVSTVSFHSITISSRGVWSVLSAEDLISNSFLSKSDLKVLSSRVLIGGMACFHCFNSATV